MLNWVKPLSIVLISTVIFSCSERDDDPLRLGSNIWPGYEPLYLARDIGLLHRDHVRLVEYTSASEVIRGFINGNLDAAALTLDEALVIKETGIPIKIILITDISYGGDVILAQRGIDDFTGLVGKKVGVESSALGAYLLIRALELNKMALNDITTQNLPIDEHESAFLNKSVDAIVTFDPVREKLMNDGLAHEIFSSRDIPGEIVDVIIIHEEYLNKYQYRVEQLIMGWFDALEYFRNNPDDASKYMDGRLKVGQENILALFDSIKLPNRAENIQLLATKNPKLESTVNRLQKFLVTNELLKSNIPASELFIPEIPGLNLVVEAE